jgi:hypothetical protein
VATDEGIYQYYSYDPHYAVVEGPEEDEREVARIGDGR